MTFSNEGRARRWILSAAIGAAAIAAASCASSGGAGSPTSEPATSGPTSMMTSAGMTTSAGATSPTGSDTTGGATSPTDAKCRADQLQLTVGGSQGAAGTAYTTFVVVNTSSSLCTLMGYPGVSYLDSSGAQVGPDATRTTTPAPTSVELRPADAAHFVVGNSVVIPQAGCPALVSAPTLRMYPPDDTGSLTVSAPGSDGFAVCNPSVGPMRPGATE